MTDAYLVGLDLGTTNAKALLCDASGRALHVASRRMPVRELDGGRAEYDPEALWETALAVLREALGAAPDRRAVRAVAATSVGEAGVPCAEDGQPLYPVIAWFDPRGGPQAEALAARIGDRALYEITGLPGLPIHTVHKLAWLRDSEPDAFRRLRRWYFVADYVLWRLCGAWVTDASLASRSRMYDIRRGRWSPEVLDAAGIPPAVLPPVVPAGSPAGRLRPDVARALGAAPDLLVAVGGHDHICASLAAGVTEPGDILDSMGTAEAMLAAADAPPPPDLTSAAGFAVGRHVVPDRFYLLGGITMSGGAVEWIAHLVGMPLPDLMGRAGRVSAGAEGLCFLPHLRGSLSPVVDRFSMGAFLGVRDVHGPGHFARAVLEGLACEAKANGDALERIAGRAGVMRVTGGGARNALWLEIKAAVLNRPLEVLATAECAALGAALLAGIAAGVFRDAGEAMRAGVRVGARVEPDPALVPAMAARDRLHAGLYAAAAPFHRRLRGGPAAPAG